MKVNEINIEDVEKMVAEDPITKSSLTPASAPFKIEFEVVLADRVDFVIRKTMKRTVKVLAFILSAGVFYIYNETKDKLETLSFSAFSSFFNGFKEAIELKSGEKIEFDVNKSEAVRMLWAIICASNKDFDIESLAPSFPDLIKNEKCMEAFYKIEDIEKEFDGEIEGLKKELYTFDYYHRYLNQRFLKHGYCYYPSIPEVNPVSITKTSQKLALMMKKHDPDFSDGSMSLLNIFAYSLYMNYDLNAVKSLFDKVETSVADHLKTNMYRKTYEIFGKEFFKKNGFSSERLITYFVYDFAKQGLSERDISTYEDYLEMSIQLYGRIIDKYPKHLYMQHNILKRENDEKDNYSQYAAKFKDAVSQWDNFEYAYMDYAIIKPTEAEDLIKEGTALSHCVASYVPKVANGDDVVLFMRRRKEKEVPLFTIEVIGNVITQIEGYQQSIVLTKDQFEFVNYWALNKGLEISAPIEISAGKGE
jgi:hypothetical protein